MNKKYKREEKRANARPLLAGMLTTMMLISTSPAIVMAEGVEATEGGGGGGEPQATQPAQPTPQPSPQQPQPQPQPQPQQPAEKRNVTCNITIKGDDSLAGNNAVGVGDGYCSLVTGNYEGDQNSGRFVLNSPHYNAEVKNGMKIRYEESDKKVVINVTTVAPTKTAPEPAPAPTTPEVEGGGDPEESAEDKAQREAELKQQEKERQEAEQRAKEEAERKAKEEAERKKEEELEKIREEKERLEAEAEAKRLEEEEKKRPKTLDELAELIEEGRELGYVTEGDKHYIMLDGVKGQEISKEDLDILGILDTKDREKAEKLEEEKKQIEKEKEEKEKEAKKKQLVIGLSLGTLLIAGAIGGVYGYRRYLELKELNKKKSQQVKEYSVKEVYEDELGNQVDINEVKKESEKIISIEDKVVDSKEIKEVKEEAFKVKRKEFDKMRERLEEEERQKELEKQGNRLSRAERNKRRRQNKDN